jgi:predicted ATP-dependent endonuclease of OLD family
MNIYIEDWYSIHNGYNLELKTGYTALVGPNGAGKTTLIRYLKEKCEEQGYNVFYYNNLYEGGGTAIQRALDMKENSLCIDLALSSEGEQIAKNLGRVAIRIGQTVAEIKKTEQPLVILLDAIDSGASIDKLKEIRNLFTLISKDTKDYEVYIISSCNNYELAKNADCVNVRTGKHKTFRTYEDFENFICKYT